MKAVIQVVDNASLSVDDKIVSKIGKGMVVYFCVEKVIMKKNCLFLQKIGKFTHFS